jgi:uncharacterized protein YfdQ (DUF2303 family)
VYVHKDLVQVVDPFLVEQHIGPIKRTERFGDVESWVSYVQAYSPHDAEVEADGLLLTWSEAGLAAVLDYHSVDEPGRCQWQAIHPFERSVQWRAWLALADGKPKPHRQALEALEDLAPDIVQPDAATLAGILRQLRASSAASADTELRPDGTTRVSFTRNTSVKSGAGELDLPAEFQIAIPILKGHSDEKGAPVLYRLGVRLRVGVDDSAHLALRFSIPSAERALEDVFRDRVEHARTLLGDGYALLRAAGSRLDP